MKVVELLLEGDTKAQTHTWGFSPFCAAICCRGPAVGLLVEESVGVDIKSTSSGLLPLILFVTKHCDLAVKLLIERSASTLLAAKNGFCLIA